MWTLLVSVAVFCLYVTAAIFALRAAQTARTPQGAVGWVVFLISAPVFGVPLYLFLGHHRFRGYRIARKQSESVVEGIKTLRIICRFVQPAMRPASRISGGTDCSATMVTRTMGGIA